MDFSTTLNDVTSNNTLAVRQPALFARLLACVLLTFVAYTATADVTHTHGRLTNNQRATSTVSFSDPGKSSSTTKDARSDGECLICQLHQHLFASLLQVVPGVVSPVTQPAQTPAVISFYLSQSDTPHSGRGPPLDSLL